MVKYNTYYCAAAVQPDSLFISSGEHHFLFHCDTAWAVGWSEVFNTTKQEMTLAHFKGAISKCDRDRHSFAPPTASLVLMELESEPWHPELPDRGTDGHADGAPKPTWRYNTRPRSAKAALQSCGHKIDMRPAHTERASRLFVGSTNRPLTVVRLFFVLSQIPLVLSIKPPINSISWHHTHSSESWLI